jgi:predicted ArsR family transcriptional regulator
MEIVWTGTREREDAEAARIYVSSPEPRTVTLQDRVRTWLRTNGESTAGAIGVGLGADPSGVNTALFNLRHAGVVEITERTVRTDYGRRAKCYRIVEGR